MSEHQLTVIYYHHLGFGSRRASCCIGNKMIGNIFLLITITYSQPHTCHISCHSLQAKNTELVIRIGKEHDVSTTDMIRRHTAFKRINTFFIQCICTTYGCSVGHGEFIGHSLWIHSQREFIKVCYWSCPVRIIACCKVIHQTTIQICPVKRNISRHIPLNSGTYCLRYSIFPSVGQCGLRIRLILGYIVVSKLFRDKVPYQPPSTLTIITHDSHTQMVFIQFQYLQVFSPVCTSISPARSV